LPPVQDPREAIAVLADVVAEVDDRLANLALRGGRSIRDLQDPPPRWVVMIDDLLPLMRTDKSAVAPLLLHLAGRGRPAGVHCVLVSSGSIAELGEIASNVTEQIAFDRDLVSGAAVPEAILGARRLELGEFLWEPMEATYPLRGRSVPVSSLEARRAAVAWGLR
jgi:hypothetical protein